MARPSMITTKFRRGERGPYLGVLMDNDHRTQRIDELMLRRQQTGYRLGLRFDVSGAGAARTVLLTAASRPKQPPRAALTRRVGRR